MAPPRISFRFWQALEPLLFCFIKIFLKNFLPYFLDSHVLTRQLAIMMRR